MARNARPTSQSDPKQRPTVLVVEDDVQSAELMQAYLEGLPADVVTAGNGVEAMEVVRRGRRPDLILLDVMMPRMSGFQVCRRLKADPETRDIPVLMVTALGSVGDEEEARDAGTDAFVTKPVSRFELLTRVKFLLR